MKKVNRKKGFQTFQIGNFNKISCGYANKIQCQPAALHFKALERLRIFTAHSGKK